MQVGIVAQRDNDRAVSLAADLHARLAERAVETTLDAETASSLDRSGTDPREMRGADLAISIGGDGTFLYTARAVGTTPIMGINLGEVGFLNAVPPADAMTTVAAVVDRYESTGQIETERLDRVEAAGADWSLGPALNEIIVQGERRGPGAGCPLEMVVDGAPFVSGHADGVLVATPTGSTAYNLSERGPLVHPTVGGLLITQMCPEQSMPSLVVDRDSTVEITVPAGSTAYAIGDGRDRVRIEPPETVAVERSPEPVRVAGPPVDFFEALEKLD